MKDFKMILMMLIHNRRINKSKNHPQNYRRRFIDNDGFDDDDGYDEYRGYEHEYERSAQWDD